MTCLFNTSSSINYSFKCCLPCDYTSDGSVHFFLSLCDQWVENCTVCGKQYFNILRMCSFHFWWYLFDFFHKLCTFRCFLKPLLLIQFLNVTPFKDYKISFVKHNLVFVILTLFWAVITIQQSWLWCCIVKHDLDLLLYLFSNISS